MRRPQYPFVLEPRGLTYRKLLDFSINECTTALMVVRPSISLSPDAQNVINSLGTFLLSEKESHAWPGTELVGGEPALVRTYRLEQTSAALLGKVADGLYDWIQPDLPEDLCLLRADDTPWMVTIAHEKDSYLELTDKELYKLQDSVTNIGTFLGPADT